MKKIVLLSALATMLIFIGCSHQESNLYFEDEPIAATLPALYRVQSLPSLDTLLMSDDSCRQLLRDSYADAYPLLVNIKNASLTELYSDDFAEDVLEEAGYFGLFDSADSLRMGDSIPSLTFYLYSLPQDAHALVRPYKGAFKVLTYIEGYHALSLDMFTDYSTIADAVNEVRDSVALEAYNKKYACIHRHLASTFGVGIEDAIGFHDFTKLMKNELLYFNERILNPCDFEFFGAEILCSITNHFQNWKQTTPFNSFCLSNSIVGSVPLCIAKLMIYERIPFWINGDKYSPDQAEDLSTNVLFHYFPIIQNSTSTIPSRWYPVTTNLNAMLYLMSLGFTLDITNENESLADKENVVFQQLEMDHPVIAIRNNKWYLIVGVRNVCNCHGQKTTTYKVDSNAEVGSICKYDVGFNLEKCTLISYALSSDIHGIDSDD